MFFTSALTLSASMAQANMIGSEGGGGGNIPAAEQVTGSWLVRASTQSKTVVLEFVNEFYFETLPQNCADRSGTWAKDACPIADKLFRGETTIYDVLKNLSIELRFKEACTDNVGQPRDGSIYGQRPGSLCLSLKTIHGKVSQDDYRNQLAALLLHESSHLVGTSEPEAIWLQTQSLAAFSVTTAVRAYGVAMQAGETLGDGVLSQYMDQWNQWMNQGDLTGLCQATGELSDKFTQLHDEDDEAGISLSAFTPAIENIFLSMHARLQAITGYLCSVDPQVPAAQRAQSAASYSAAFGVRSQMPANQYPDQKLSQFNPLMNGKIALSRIIDTSSLKTEVAAINTAYKSINAWSQSDEVVFYDVYSNECEIVNNDDDFNKNCPL